MSESPLRARELEVVEGDEQELLRSRRSQVSSPASRPPSRVEILLMDMAKSQAESVKTLETLTLGQRELTSGQRELVLGQQDLSKAQSELANTQMGQVVGLADLAGRITSIESSIQGSRNPSPFPDYRLTHKTSPRLPL